MEFIFSLKWTCPNPIKSILIYVCFFSSNIKVAARIRSLLHSDVFESKCYVGNEPDRKVQDPYTMRCIPQVHGIVNDTVKFCAKIIETEMNSATDNPMVLKDRQILISGGKLESLF